MINTPQNRQVSTVDLKRTLDMTNRNELYLDNSLGFDSPPGVAFGLAGAEVGVLPTFTVEAQFF